MSNIILFARYYALVIAAMSIVGFGNAFNDIIDLETDRISHLDRPLPPTRRRRNFFPENRRNLY
ncbi:MAG: hypothetical protein WBM07_11170 [Chitinivibrionales bacterium]